MLGRHGVVHKEVGPIALVNLGKGGITERSEYVICRMLISKLTLICVHAETLDEGDKMDVSKGFGMDSLNKINLVLAWLCAEQA